LRRPYCVIWQKLGANRDIKEINPTRTNNKCRK
jgi:hypothetical protein